MVSTGGIPECRFFPGMSLAVTKCTNPTTCSASLVSNPVILYPGLFATTSAAYSIPAALRSLVKMLPPVALTRAESSLVLCPTFAVTASGQCRVVTGSPRLRGGDRTTCSRCSALSAHRPK